MLKVWSGVLGTVLIGILISQIKSCNENPKPIIEEKSSITLKQNLDKSDAVLQEADIRSRNTLDHKEKSPVQ